eukprot:1183881-Prorocentrum_minimum.AAC.2
MDEGTYLGSAPALRRALHASSRPRCAADISGVALPWKIRFGTRLKDSNVEGATLVGDERIGRVYTVDTGRTRLSRSASTRAFFAAVRGSKLEVDVRTLLDLFVNELDVILQYEQ